MLARLTEALPPTEGWRYEVKLDGIRAVVVKNGDGVRVFSRRPRDITNDFPEIVAALQAHPGSEFTLDGEIVALDGEGRSSFQLLQNRNRPGADRTPLRYVVFDVLNWDGAEVTTEPFDRRRALLERSFSPGQTPLALSPILEAEPRRIWEAVKGLGLEGLVAKQGSSRYESGQRSGAWLKIKTHREQEFVIGGYTEPRGSRRYFGSVLVGFCDAGKLIFASGVGTGFDEAQLRGLFDQFQPLRTSACPFANLPTRRASGRSGGLTAADMRRCTWLEPRLVCQVRFQEWTHDGNLRQPVFLGLRVDKRPRDVVRELP